MEVKTPVVAITKLGQVARQMFVVDGVISADDGVFHIANHGVDPSKLDMGHAGRASASHNAGVLAACLSDSPKAWQPIGDHLTLRAEMMLGPPSNFARAKSSNDIHVHRDRMPLCIHGYGCHKRRLVWGSSAPFATATLTTPVGIVQLDIAG